VKPAFYKEMNAQRLEYLLLIYNIFFGLTGMNLRLLAYHLARVFNLLIPFSQRPGAGTGTSTQRICNTSIS
jgi:hypothetical protein